MMTDPTAEENANEPLYRHTKRAEWGMAILAWERPNERGYQFQDGQLRVIKNGYYELLSTVQQRPEDAVDVVTELRRQAGMADHHDRQKTRSKEGGITFAQQIKIFRMEYPKGFADDGWGSLVRGAEADRRLKRHRQPAIDEVGKALADELLKQAIAEEGTAELMESVIAMFSRTNLVKPKDLEILRNLAVTQHPQYIHALREVLYGDDPPHLRFDRFSAAHGHKGSWPLLTTPLALVLPNEKICIHPAMTRRQAAVLDPTLNVGAKPNGRQYTRLVAMADQVRSLLNGSSLTPIDLMDVFDFSSITLRPSAARLLKS